MSQELLSVIWWLIYDNFEANSKFMIVRGIPGVHFSNCPKTPVNVIQRCSNSSGPSVLEMFRKWTLIVSLL